ncbi:pyruvate formate lyase II activase [Escherichia coli]|nr:pyruvate formate lyase II activase [Escherichia coli]
MLPVFLQRLRLWGVSCAIETAGDAPASKLLPLAKLCDEVLFDLKIMDATQARDVVKMNLPRVLENLRLLVSEGVNVIPRLPLIPGFTLSRENMQQALDVLIPLNIRQIHLLPFHQYGEPKYRLLGKNMVDERGACAVVSRCDNDARNGRTGRISGYRGRLKWHTWWQ